MKKKFLYLNRKNNSDLYSLPTFCNITSCSKKKNRTAFGCHLDATAFSWHLLQISETIPLSWKQIDNQIPEKAVHMLIFMCFHCFVFSLPVKWDYNPECTGSRAPCSKPLANDGLAVTIKEANGRPLILKISLGNSSYLGRRRIVSFPSAAAENRKFSGTNSRLR